MSDPGTFGQGVPQHKHVSNPDYVIKIMLSRSVNPPFILFYYYLQMRATTEESMKNMAFHYAAKNAGELDVRRRCCAIHHVYGFNIA